MNIEELKETVENLKTGIFDRTTGTKELFLPMFEHLLSIIEQAEKAFEKILVVDLDYSCDDVEEMKSISEEALKAIRGN